MITVIILISCLLICSILNTVLGFIIQSLFKKYLDVKGDTINQDIETDVQYAIINELMSYCYKNNLHAFVDTTGDTMNLAVDKGDDKIEKILELKFPTTEVGSREYLSSLEFQKEQIDNYLKGVGKNA